MLTTACWSLPATPAAVWRGSWADPVRSCAVMALCAARALYFGIEDRSFTSLTRGEAA